MSTRWECFPTLRMKLVISVISSPHDFLRGPKREWDAKSKTTSVAGRSSVSRPFHVPEELLECSPLLAATAPYFQTSHILKARSRCFSVGSTRADGGRDPGAW